MTPIIALKKITKTKHIKRKLKKLFLIDYELFLKT